MSDYYGGGTVVDPPAAETNSGDVNGDKKINVMDLALAKTKIKLPQPDVIAASPEDVNGDGTFTVADIIRLTKYIAGLDVKLESYS